MSPRQHAVRTLRIDGRDVSARENETVLEAARWAGIAIPALCHLDGLSEVGACRLCLVEVVGSGNLLPACTTHVTEGMDLVTRTERLAGYRRTILELFFSERNHICSVCVANGNCELQRLAQEHGVTHLEVPYLHPRLPVDASHARFVVDHNRCVLCTRCVRVCDEIEGAHTWDVMGRGVGARVITDLGERWGDSESCTNCGKCVQVCPTGALFQKGRSVAEPPQRREYLPYLKKVHEEPYE